MSTSRRFKTTAIFTTLVVLLIGTVCVYANHYDRAGGWLDIPGDPDSIYWSISIGDVYFAGRSSHSGHSYAIENYTIYELSVTWEFAHKVYVLDEEDNASLYDDATEFDTVIIGKEGSRGKPSESYGRAELSVANIPRGRYYLDTYTSIDILYEEKRPNIPRRIKYKKLPIVTEITQVR